MDLSILLVQYRPDEGELRRTLASLLRQSCRDFELVVADDGSDEDFFPLTRKILAENGFTGAKFVKLTPNGGTVKNVLNGAKQAAGKWVFTVSPGDYLYDADTVAWLLEVLRRDAPRVAFGRLACYADRNGAPIRRPGDAPFDRTPYRPGAYDAKTAKRNMLLYDDGISGAGLVYERELLVHALEKMAGRVLLAEGNVLHASRPHQPELFDLKRDFKQFTAPITMVQPVDDGIWVGTTKELAFLAGTQFDALQFAPRDVGPVVLGSGVSAPGEYVAQGQGTGQGAAMLCIAGGRIVSGFNGGLLINVTRERYKTDAAEVCATFRITAGIPQYLAIPR